MNKYLRELVIIASLLGATGNCAYGIDDRDKGLHKLLSTYLMASADSQTRIAKKVSNDHVMLSKLWQVTNSLKPESATAQDLLILAGSAALLDLKIFGAHFKRVKYFSVVWVAGVLQDTGSSTPAERRIGLALEIESLQRRERRIRNMAVACSSSFGLTLLTPLLSMSKSSEAYVRLASARCLSRFASSKAKDALRGLAVDKSSAVRQYASAALRRKTEPSIGG
jgi:hypothetical protein